MRVFCDSVDIATGWSLGQVLPMAENKNQFEKPVAGVLLECREIETCSRSVGRCIQTDRKTNGRTDKQTDRRTDGQTQIDR